MIERQKELYRTFRKTIAVMVIGLMYINNVTAQYQVCTFNGNSYEILNFTARSSALFHVSFLGSTPVWDDDGDGYVLDNPCNYGVQGDCNDADDAIHPGITELCDDGIDNNCDGVVDCILPGTEVVNTNNICELFLQADLESITPIDTIQHTSHYMRPCGPTSLRQHRLVIYSSGYLPTGDFALVQLRLSLDISADGNVFYTFNGEVFENDGTYKSFVPGETTLQHMDNAKIKSCEDVLSKFASAVDINLVCQ